MKPFHAINNTVWRRLPRRHRRRILGVLEHHLPTRLFQRVLHAAGSGIYRREVTDTGVLFVHVPKAAGTAIVRALYGLQGVGHYRAVTARDINPALFRSLYRFAVVRNPWERLVSAYHFVRQGGTDEVELNNAHALHRRIPEQFEPFVLDWLVHQQPERLHSLFMPQHLFVQDGAGNLIVDALYDMGDIDRLGNDLTQRLGRPVNIARNNATGSAELLASSYRSPEVLDAVAEFYAGDVALFDYQPPVPACDGVASHPG
ncbi:MAG: sulfotransferase family 2 domain-containing protein [Ectothiorhodospiraceae bacterium]|nr:sulfotransferase family 2 domain-containing protein [Ectothiorhodospiraceae bacterium]MCH8504043.1 sulfotransferase family protein [Ectothiorhodospiraceae bacterium]